MMTVMNTPSAHDVPMANTRLVAPKDAVCVQQALLMTTPIQPHLVPLVRQALRQEKRMWDLVYLVKLDSTQAIWQPSAPTAQLAHQMATLTRPHLAQTAKLALLQQRVIRGPVQNAQLGSSQMHRQLRVLIAMLGRVITTHSPTRHVHRVWLASTPSLVSLARATDVLLVVTVLCQVARVWISVMPVWQDHTQTTALRRVLSVLGVLQISTAILRRSASSAPLARILAAVTPSATCVLQVR